MVFTGCQFQLLLSKTGTIYIIQSVFVFYMYNIQINMYLVSSYM